MANIVTRHTYGQDAIAVDCTYWACGIDDTYEDGVFKSPDGQEREYKGNEVENINVLQNENVKIKQEALDNYEELLDTQFELEQAKSDIATNLEGQLDLEFRVSQLEDTMEVA